MSSIKKVLIAEDSPTQALKLQMILEEKDYQVVVGSNGVEALALIDENDLPEIVISDIVMPEMDGYELCSKIKGNEKTRDIPVILLTQLSNPEDVIKGLQCGADNFISKPYTENFLFERINDILLNREIRKRSPNLDFALEIYFGGSKYKLNSNRLQILDLLLSTYYNAINKNRELEDKNEELKKVHNELKSRNIELKKLNDEKNQLLGIAAHDLRSPLGTISSFVQILEYSLKENTVEDQREIFNTINLMLDYMLKLISDVLDYSKIESGKLELTKDRFNFIEFMNKSIQLNNILGARKNISISAEYDFTNITVEADANKLKQVMDNLFSNAIKYSERDTHVQVLIEPQKENILVKVTDEGKGIPADEINKIFKPFSTTSVKATAGEQSTGLGLVSVKKIIETHGGSIWVESVLGKGSSFSFLLPYDPEIDKPVSSSDPINSLKKKLKILVAEDEIFSDQYLTIISFDISSEILHATNGNEAIKICREYPTLDLIFMDINMPEMNGIEATRKIREFNENVCIIAQTAYGEEFTREIAIKAGCNDFITKPIDKKELMKKIVDCFT